MGLALSLGHYTKSLRPVSTCHALGGATPLVCFLYYHSIVVAIWAYGEFLGHTLGGATRDSGATPCIIT